MDCLIQLAALCLFNLSGLSLTADTNWQIAGDFTYYERYRPYDGPMGRLALIMEVPFTEQLQLRYGFEHRSMLMAGDRGEERFLLAVTWRPFR